MPETSESLYTFLPAFMKMLFFLLIVLLIYSRKTVWNSFREINKKTWLLLFLIILLAFLLRFFWVPHGQIVFYDGFNWVSQALSIQEHNIYGLCEFTSGDSCLHYSFHTWPPAYHTMLAVVFSVFGGSESVAFNFSAFIGTVSVLFVFLLSYLWTKKEDIALISAFVFSMLPVFLKFSGTVALSFFSVFFILLTLIFFEIFIKEKKRGVFLLFMVSLLCVAYIRPENIFLVPLFLFFFWLRGGVGFSWDKKNRTFFTVAFVYFFLLLAPALLLIYIGKNYMSYEGWNPTITETVGYFLKHSPGNLYFFINYLINPFLFLFFAVLGMIFSFIKERREFFFFFLFLVFYFILYSSYDEGSFTGTLIRRALILYVPLLYFFTKGMFFFLTEIGNKLKKIAVFIFTVFFAASLIPTQPYIFERSPQKIVIDLLLLSKNRIPENAYLVSSNNALVRSTLKKSGASFLVFKKQNEYFKDKEVFLLKDIWWWILDECEIRGFIYRNYDLEPIETDTYKTHGNTHEVGVYRLIKK